MKRQWNFFFGALILILVVLLFVFLQSQSAARFTKSAFDTLNFIFNKENLSAVFTAVSEEDMKYVYIIEGMRKEEVARVFSKALEWNEIEENTFSERLGCYVGSKEGYLFPGSYVVPKGSTIDDVEALVKSRFEEKISEILIDADPSITLEKALIIASLIQREAAGKRDMNLISGVIWNRLLADMPLAIDATLQYIKGDEDRWWPQVASKDKFIDSPYNTYLNEGLPPTPIANPGLAAIIAAYNPAETSCLYYIHDRLGRIHCSPDYEGHKRNINLYLR